MLIEFASAVPASVHATHALALLALQTPDAINTGHATLLEVFTGLVAFALLVQAAVVLVAGLAAMKAVKEIEIHVRELRGKATPLITEAHGLVTDLSPKVKEVVTDLQPKIKSISSKVDEIVTDLTPKVKQVTTEIEHIAAVAREKVDEFGPTVSSANQTVRDANETVQDANRKVRSQVSRVNGMVTATLDGAARLGAAIEHGITRPGREVAGLVSGLKVGLETLMSGARAFGSGSVGRRAARPVPANDVINQPGGPARPAVVPYRSMAEQQTAPPVGADDPSLR